MLVFVLIPAQAAIINLNSNIDCAQANARAATCVIGGTGTGIGTMTLDPITGELLTEDRNFFEIQYNDGVLPV